LSVFDSCHSWPMAMRMRHSSLFLLQVQSGQGRVEASQHFLGSLTFIAAQKPWWHAAPP